MGECPRCGPCFLSVVSPVCFPIQTVALVCRLCGRVIRYVDNLLIFTKSQAFFAFTRRPWVVRHRAALQPSNADSAREMILMGLDAGLSFEDVAEVLNATPEWAKSMARSLA
jgi:hypothetical protein